MDKRNFMQEIMQRAKDCTFLPFLCDKMGVEVEEMGRGYLTDADKEWGRPTLYKDSYADMLVAYFDVPLRTAAGKATDMPTLAGFASSIGVSYQTIKKWHDCYPDFAEAYDACKARTLDRLIKFGLSGDYSGNFAKFLMVNDFCDDYKDKRDVDVKQDTTISFAITASGDADADAITG